jgi:Putative prokaryotic signal transducing protein
MGEAAASDELSNGDLVEVASVNDPVEGEMIRGLLQNDGIPSILQPVGINGPLLGIGLLSQGAQRVVVRASQVDTARRLLAETMVKRDVDVDDLANAAYLDDAKERGPRSYGLIGAYVRIWLWSLAALGVAFGVFLLARAI